MTGVEILPHVVTWDADATASDIQTLLVELWRLCASWDVVWWVNHRTWTQLRRLHDNEHRELVRALDPPMHYQLLGSPVLFDDALADRTIKVTTRPEVSP